MKSQIFACVVSLSFIMQACAPKKSDDKKTSSSDAGAAESALVNTSEHCLDEKASACFIQTEDNGRSVFYTTEAYNKTWLVNQGVIDTGITLEVVSPEKYQDYLASSIVPRMVYGKTVSVNLDVVDEYGQQKALPGREANARVRCPPKACSGGLSSLSGLLKGGKGAGAFSKIFGKFGGGAKKSSGGLFKKIAIALGVGALFGYSSSQGGAVNARKDALSKPFDVPLEYSLGGEKASETVTLD